jgi:hypothetical protein
MPMPASIWPSFIITRLLCRVGASCAAPSESGVNAPGRIAFPSSAL